MCGSTACTASRLGGVRLIPARAGSTPNHRQKIAEQRTPERSRTLPRTPPGRPLLADHDPRRKTHSLNLIHRPRRTRLTNTEESRVGRQVLLPSRVYGALEWVGSEEVPDDVVRTDGVGGSAHHGGRIEGRRAPRPGVPASVDNVELDVRARWARVGEFGDIGSEMGGGRFGPASVPGSPGGDLVRDGLRQRQSRSVGPRSGLLSPSFRCAVVGG